MDCRVKPGNDSNKLPPSFGDGLFETMPGR